ncbi:hypothetical protein [Armatimonas sp.]|uniref:hypothetical protein n=1 Tax=Armatimonas sp. TaxID=1872638 RepID=UPI0037529F23
MSEINLNSVSNVAIRIRFSGSPTADQYHLTLTEGARFAADWEAYLKGNSIIGGAYTIEEADHPVIISLNFSLIAYIENGKIY